MKVTEKLEEVGRHGNEFLPFEHYYGDCNIFKEIYTHWHKEMEFIYIRRGSGLFRINREVIIGHEGDLIMIGKEMIHHVRSNKKDTLHFESIVFDPGILAGIVEDLCQINLVHPLMKKEVTLAPIVRKGDEQYHDIIQCFFRVLKVFMEKEKYYYVELKGQLYQLFYELLKGGYIQTGGNTDGRQIEAVKSSLDYIRVHYGETITVKELAEKAHYSEYYFMKLFKDYTGKTVTVYTNEYRVEKAKYFLTQTELSITEIAEKAGFCSASYFIQKFQCVCKMTPQKFRKMNLTS